MDVQISKKFTAAGENIVVVKDGVTIFEGETIGILDLQRILLNCDVPAITTNWIK